MAQRNRRRVAAPIVIAAAGAAGTASPPADAAVDMFLKLSGIDGTSVTPPYENWVEIDGFSWGLVSEADIGSGGTTPRVAIRGVRLIKAFDRTSPLLAKYAVAGLIDPEIRLVIRDRGTDGTPFTCAEIRMENALVTGFNVGAETETLSTVERKGSESLKIEFETLCMTTFEEDGTEASRECFSTIDSKI